MVSLSAFYFWHCSSRQIPEQSDFGLLFQQVIFLLVVWRTTCLLEVLQKKSSSHQRYSLLVK